MATNDKRKQREPSRGGDSLTPNPSPIGRGEQPSEAFVYLPPGGGDDPTNPWPWLTGERLLYAIIMVVAAFMRFVALGTRPLDDGEAALAMQAWNALRGDPVDLMAQPLLVYGTSLMFIIFGANDTIARMLPAVAGTALVATPYFIRRLLGQGPALVGTLLLAVSPICIYYSTSLNSAMIAVLVAGASIVALLRASPPHRAAIAATGLALLCVSGPVGVAAAASLGIAVAAHWAGQAFQRRKYQMPLVVGVPGDRRWLVGAIAVYALVATGLGANLGGLQAGLPDGLAAWLGNNHLTGELLLIWLAYELPVVLLAIAAAIEGWRRWPAAPWLAGFTAAGMLVSMVGGDRVPGLALLFSVPATLLAAQLAGRTAMLLANRQFRVGVGIFLLAIGPWSFLLWLWAGHFSRPNADAMVVLGSTSPTILLIPVGGLLALTVGLVVWWIGAVEASRRLTVAVLLAAVVCGLHGSAAFIAPNLEAPAQPLAPRLISPDVMTMVYELRAAADAQTYYPGMRDIQVDEHYRTPLAWYLRETPAVRFVTRVDENASAAIIGTDAQAPNSKYRARRYQLAFQMQGDPLDAPLDIVWRWLMFRERLAAPLSEGVVLLVRSR
jgi:hypothetical protein